MARLLIYYAHPGHKHSRVNRALAEVAREHTEVTFVDLYHDYPRYNIDIEKEQERLLNHDVIIFQHPLFWYSTPALIKEWIDLVLEHGFAYGSGGDKLSGKMFMNVISAAGPQEAYQPEGYQHYPLRTFLTPLEQTARLCHMRYLAPYALFSALDVDGKNVLKNHIDGYRSLINAICGDVFDIQRSLEVEIITSATVNDFIGS